MKIRNKSKNSKSAKMFKLYNDFMQAVAKARRDSRHLMNVIQGYNEKLKLIRAFKGKNTSMGLPALKS